MSKLLAALLLSFACSAQAYYAGTLPPNIGGRIERSSDTEDFDITSAVYEVNHKSGMGVRLSYTDYNGKQPYSRGIYLENATDFTVENFTTSNKFSGHSEKVQATYVIDEEDYRFDGAIGFRNVGYKILSVQKNVTNKENEIITKFQNQFGPVVSSERYAIDEPLRTSGSDTYFAADGDLQLIMTDSVNVGIYVIADVVESVRSFQTRTRYVTVGSDVDWILTDKLSLNVYAGHTNYTDDNNTNTIKTKLTYTLLPEYGISVFGKLGRQDNTNPGTGNYFAPDDLLDKTVGASWRKFHNNIVYSARGEVGRRLVHNDNDSSTTPIFSWAIQAETQPGKKTGITYGAGLQGTNISGVNAGDDNYKWIGGFAWIKVPY